MQVSKKVVVLGHFGVGKTSLIRRIVEDSFSDTYKVSIGVHITKKTIKISGDSSVSLVLWDLEGTDQLEQIRSSYLLGTHALVYVFDVSRPSTFKNIERDLAKIKQKKSGIPIRVVGNKEDLITTSKAAELLRDHKVPYDYLTSAKTGNQVDDLFERLAKMLIPDVETI